MCCIERHVLQTETVGAAVWLRCPGHYLRFWSYIQLASNGLAPRLSHHTQSYRLALPTSPTSLASRLHSIEALDRFWRVFGFRFICLLLGPETFTTIYPLPRKSSRISNFRILFPLLSLASELQSVASLQDGTDLKALNDLLSKLSAQTLVGTRDSDPLELLDNRANSLGVLYALFARLSVDKNEIHQLWPKLIDFFSEFDGRQTKFSRDQLFAVLKVLLQFCEACNKPILALKPLEHTITQLNYSTGAKTFSSLHTKFVKKCLDARSFRAALPILDIDIEEFPVKGSEKDVTYREVLQYFLYGAMIYIATKKWRRASDFLQFVLSYPGTGTAVSQIQVDAFKKFVLVTLMLEGRNFQLPKTIPQSTARACRILARPYEAFATAYATGNPDLLRREAALVKEIFQADGNWGIAEQCLENFRRLGIKALTSTYSTLSIEAIASRDLDVLGPKGSTTSPEELERYILDMIDRKEIKASLSHSSTNEGTTSCMVSFHDLPSSETDILKDLEAQIARTVQITNQARQLDKKLGLSKEWINFTSKKRGGPGGANDHVDQGFEEMDDYPIQGRGGILDMAAMGGMVGAGMETQFHDYMGAYDPADDDMQPDYDD